MNAPEPDGCYWQWDDHTCIEDERHDGDHECTCGAVHSPSDPSPEGGEGQR